MSLSDTQCRAAAKKDKPYKLADGESLYLEVTPSGSKYWRLKYRIQGKEKRIALGVYPNVPLIEAKQRKTEIKLELKKDIDPALCRLEKNQTQSYASNQTFELVALEWYTQPVKSQLRGKK